MRFESVGDGGVKLAKTYTFTRGSYQIGVKHELTNNGAAAVTPQLYLGLERDGNPARGESKWYFTFTGPAVYTEAKKYEKIDFKDIEKGKASHVTSANDGWVAMVQHYFASAWLVPAGTAREFRTQKVGHQPVRGADGAAARRDRARARARRHEATLFAGPQEENKLEAMAPGLELVKDYGWFTVLAKPLFWVLDQLHKLLGNWGWSIVALVVLLKIAFYWLNASAYRSMGKMKALAPRITDMRERYKDKPQLMQQEMMRIYREEKVNPLGGCLPIAGADAVLHRAVLGAAVVGGNAQRAVDRLDPRPVGARPVLRAAAADDRVVAVPGLAAAGAGRSDAGQDDVDDAAHLRRHVLLLPGRPGAVLADEQHPVDRAAVVDQPPARREVSAKKSIGTCV